MVLWGRKVVVAGCPWVGMMVGERVEGREGIGIGDRMGEGLHINCIGNFLTLGFINV